MLRHVKDKTIMTVSMSKFAIKGWTQKNEFPHGEYLRSLNHPSIAIHRPYDITDIQYDEINNEIESMELVQYNASIGRNVMNKCDI